MTDSDAPKLHIDSDWKAQAQAEKEKLAQKAAASKAPASGNTSTPGTPGSTPAGSDASETPGAGAPGGGQIPQASFEVLISTMATQALFALGGIPDPRTGQRMTHLGLARHHIDLLSILLEKTEGNLSDDEKNMLSQTLYELRNRYIQLSTAERDEQAL